MSEPDAGSDVSSLRTRAVYDERADEWVLNGVKTWITNGGIADVHVVVAAVDPALGARGQASFVVPRGTSGLSMGTKFRKLGIRASHTAEVILDDVRVPGGLVLGGRQKLEERLARARDGGHAHGRRRSPPSRPPGRRSVRRRSASPGPPTSTRSTTPTRRQFGRRIIDNQAISFLLADMATEIEAARLLVRRAAWLTYNGEFSNAEGSMAKPRRGGWPSG